MNEGNIILRMQLLRKKAKRVLRSKSLRHTPNEHDIKEVSDGTKLLNIHQQKAISK